MRSLRRLLATWLAVGAIVAGPATGERRALAAPMTEGQRLRAARQHYEQAISHYNLDELEPALAEFREAYRFKPDPSLLFNIAQCHRKLGQREAAIDFYRKYVRASPDANNRAEAERWIAELKTGGDESAGAASANGASTAGAPATAPAAPAAVAPIDMPASAPSVLFPPSASPAPASAPLALGLSSSDRAAPAATPAVYRRWWFWAALGAVAAGAAVIAISLGSPPPSPYAGNVAPGTARVPTN
jgi:tetratricopeptide (TPR) repeat protein